MVERHSSVFNSYKEQIVNMSEREYKWITERSKTGKFENFKNKFTYPKVAFEAISLVYNDMLSEADELNANLSEEQVTKMETLANIANINININIKQDDAYSTQEKKTDSHMNVWLYFCIPIVLLLHGIFKSTDSNSNKFVSEFVLLLALSFVAYFVMPHVGVFLREKLE